MRCQRVERVERCARTNLAPLSVQRDLNIPRTLRRTFGHIDCGVLQRVTRGGTLTLGETIDVV